MSSSTKNPAARVGDAIASIAMRLRNRFYMGDLARHDRRIAAGKAKIRRMLQRMKGAPDKDVVAHSKEQIDRLDRADDAISATLSTLNVDSALIGERVFTVVESVRAALLITLEIQIKPGTDENASGAMDAANNRAIDALRDYEKALAEDASDGKIDWDTAETELSDLERHVGVAHGELAAAMPSGEG